MRAIQGADDMELVGAVDLFSQGEVVADGKRKVEQDLAKMLAEKKPQVVVDFTRPQDVFANVKIILEHKIRPVVGTTGLDPEQIAQLDRVGPQTGNRGGLIAPNFAIGAVLMMEFAKCKQAAISLQWRS